MTTPRPPRVPRAPRTTQRAGRLRRDPAVTSPVHPTFHGLTVQGWFRLVFAALAVLAVAATVTVAQLLAEGRQVSADLDNRILPAQAQAYRLQSGLLNQETGVRGFALTSKADFLEPYTDGRAAEAQAAAKLRTLIGGNPQLVTDLTRLERAAAGWRSSYAIPLIALARNGPLTGNQTALLDRSRSSFDKLRALFNVQNAHLATAAAHDRARVNGIRTEDDWTFGIVVAAFVLAAVALMLALNRTVIRPLNRLRLAARRVVDGDFGHRIDIAGPSDLRVVSADVEAMRSELVTALEEARAAQADLDAQAAELIRSNAELEQFAYVASHDLQEPLRKVASFCQLLEKRYSDQLDDRGRQYIGFAVDGAKRLQVLINDLLTFSRVGRGNEVSVRLSLDGPLDDAIGALGAAIEESGTAIERPSRLPDVMGDATLLGMLWQNLLSNAIKFRSPDRKPVLRIICEPVTGAGSAVANDSGEMWQFCVEDNGIGIPGEFAEKVFVIFQRLHSRDAYPGTGIGLALCRRIVEHHGGQISVDAGRAEGTRICFTLPQIDETSQPGQPGADDPIPSAEGIPA
jgi:signal transduction histidine kinase